jgi:uncharacterized membrane protein HdeD (DUF308 family)
MSAALARNWWLIGLRALAAVVFILCVALLPLQNIASLVVLFAAYVVADGALAILAGLWAARRGERWWSLIIEGAMNLAAAAILVWPAVVAFPFVNLTAAWAIITGALLFAAAHRLAVRHGRWLVVFGGAVSVAWGLLAATLGPAAMRGRSRRGSPPTWSFSARQCSSSACACSAATAKRWQRRTRANNASRRRHERWRCKLPIRPIVRR